MSLMTPSKTDLLEFELFWLREDVKLSRVYDIRYKDTN